MRNIENISSLPSLAIIKKNSQGLALLDAILMPDWELRYFSYDSKWNETTKETLASIRDGEGNNYFLNFMQHGMIGSITCRSISETAAPFLTKIPTEFESFRTEAAFDLEHASFVFWQTSRQKDWSIFPIPHRGVPLLDTVAEGLQKYIHWAVDYYETTINFATAKDVFQSLQVTSSQLEILNPDRQLTALNADLEGILG